RRLAVVVVIAAGLAVPAGAAGTVRAGSPAGTVVTVMGGVGGPAPATAVSLGYVCGVAAAGGVTYAASDGDGLVRAIAGGSGRLTTPAGVGVVATSGDGGPATLAELDLNEGACAVAVDRAGNLLIDQNDRVRVVARRTGFYDGMRRVAGRIYTIAGGGPAWPRDGAPATRVSIAFSGGLAVDRSGNVLLTDLTDNQILCVAVRSGRFFGMRMHRGDIYSIAGDGQSGYSGDRGPARRAELSAPTGVAVDSSGDVMIADGSNHRVRIVPARTGRHFGRFLKAGDIYTIAGNGIEGDRGD